MIIMQQSISSVQTVSCGGDFIKCSRSKNTLFSARHNPSLPSVLQSVPLFSLIVSLYLSFGFLLFLSLSLTCLNKLYFPYLLLLPLSPPILSSAIICPRLSSSPLLRTTFLLFLQGRKFWSLWKVATKMSALCLGRCLRLYLRLWVNLFLPSACLCIRHMALV